MCLCLGLCLCVSVSELVFVCLVFLYLCVSAFLGIFTGVPSVSVFILVSLY